MLLPYLISYQEIKSCETQTETFVEDLMTKVHDLIEKNNSVKHLWQGDES